MIMIEVFTTNESEKWDEIVRSMKEYDIYYLSGYVKAFELHGDGKALLIYMHNSACKAIQVLIKRDISEAKEFQGILEPNKFFDAVTPYGYGGILAEGEGIGVLLEEYQRYCVKNGIISEFVRFHPFLQNENLVSEFYTVIPLGDTVYMDTANREVIWKNISSKNRNMIRKAKKAGIQIYWGREPEMIDIFREIYNQTMEKDQAEEYYFFNREFYESILNDLKQEAMWFYAELDGKVIAMSIFLFVNGNMHYHLSGSIKECQNMAPSNLLLYEAAVWASEHGYKRLHLGGGVGASHDSLYKFKKAFNRGEDMHFAIGKKIYMPEIYEKLVKMRMENSVQYDTESTFFPKYRA